MKGKRMRVGDAIELVRRPVQVDPLGTYKEIGLRSFGKGIFHKESVDGVTLGSKRVFEIHPGDLVLSNVFAWEGAVGLAGEAERGLIGSHRFMTYVAKSSDVYLSYVYHFFISEPGLALINRASPGSAGRNKTLAIDRFESLEISLPEIGDQRRVSAKLEQLLALSDRASRRAADLATLNTALRASLLNQAFAGLQ